MKMWKEWSQISNWQFWTPWCISGEWYSFFTNSWWIWYPPPSCRSHCQQYRDSYNNWDMAQITSCEQSIRSAWLTRFPSGSTHTTCAWVAIYTKTGLHATILELEEPHDWNLELLRLLVAVGSHVFIVATVYLTEFNEPTHAGHCLDRLYSSELTNRAVQSIISTAHTKIVACADAIQIQNMS